MTYKMTLKGKLRQFMGASIMSFPKFLLGSGVVWSSYSLIYLKGPYTPLNRPVTMMEEAMIGGLPLIGSLLASPFGGMMLDRYGRKVAGVITVVSIALSWIIVAFATQVPLILLARFLVGMSGGTLMQVAWSFTAEVSEDSVRGFMSSMPAVLYSLGALVSIVLGWVTGYQEIVYINLVLALGDIACMCMIPESPVYLSMIGKENEALKSLAFYRAGLPTDKSVIDEFDIIKKRQHEKQYEISVRKKADETKDIYNGVQQKVTGFKYFRVNAAARWSFFIIMTIMTFSCLTGVIAIQIYGGSLFLKAAPSLSPDLCAVLLASVLLVGSVSGASISDWLGRRGPLITAALINSICMFGLGALVRWPWGPVWLVPLLILVFCLAFNFGGGSIPFLLIAECFVPEVKACVQSLGMLILNFINAVLLLAFVPAVELIGLDIVFFAFGVFAVATSVFTYCFLPETKGANPYDIEKMFLRKTT